MPVSRCKAPRPTWWLVMTSPSAETKEPEPLGKRTDDFCRWSYHACEASNWYLAFKYSLGAALKSHKPSSAESWFGCIMVVTRIKKRSQRKRFIRCSPGDEHW